MQDLIDDYTRRLALAYSTLPAVRAVALGGSRRGPWGPDSLSDIDLYVYQESPIPPAERRRLVPEGSRELEIANRFWEEGDEWLSQDPPVKVDVMFRDILWIEDQLDKVLVRHEAQLGYSTCFLYNVQSCEVLYDRNGWLVSLKARALQAYPQELRDAILAKNHPVLRSAHSAYASQIQSAAARGDRVAIHHRVAALLASYFDIVIAVNGLAHPGEKKLMAFVREKCPLKPEGFEARVESLIQAIPQHGSGVMNCVHQLLDDLDGWLSGLGFTLPWPLKK